MKRNLFILTLLLVIVFLFVGCANQPSTVDEESSDSNDQSSDVVEVTKIGFGNISDDGDYFAVVKKGMQDAAAANGVELISVDNQFDGIVAVQNVDVLINAGVQAVIWYFNDTTVNKTVKDKLDAAGIPIVAVDIPVENSNGSAPYFGGDNYSAGFITGTNLGEAALEKWGGEIDLYISVETPAIGETNQLRMGGALDGIRSVIDVPDDLIVRVDGNDQMLLSQQVVTDALTANPNARRILIATVQDDMTQGAFAAVEIAGRQDQVLLAGNGPFASTLANLRKDEPNFWIGSTSFAPEQYGPKSVPLAIALAKGETVPENTFPDHYFLTHANINEFYPE